VFNISGNLAYRALNPDDDRVKGPAMSYLILKYVHILSATLLFGTGLGTAFHGFLAFRTRDPKIVAAVGRSVILADWLFTAPAVLIQPATGFWLASQAGLPLTTGWIAVSVGLYILMGACWLPVLWLQIRLRNIARESEKKGGSLPPLYFKYLGIWFLLGWPALLSTLGIFYFMVFQPEITLLSL
jgi:uncharacterized membrane protein